MSVGVEQVGFRIWKKKGGCRQGHGCYDGFMKRLKIARKVG